MSLFMYMHVLFWIYVFILQNSYIPPKALNKFSFIKSNKSESDVSGNTSEFLRKKL
jgi:hypothetical protein